MSRRKQSIGISRLVSGTAAMAVVLGTASAGAAPVNPKPDAVVWSLETAYQIDLDGDGYIGRPPLPPGNGGGARVEA